MTACCSSVCDPVVIKIRLKAILGSEAGIPEIPFFISPLMQSSIIKHLHIVFDDERYDFISQALFEEDQSSYAAIPVLKRMNRFKPVAKSTGN